MSRSILIIAGGTGGHIVPGLGLARELQKSFTVHFLTLGKDRGYADFNDLPFPLHTYDAPPIRRSLRGLVSFPLRFAKALFAAHKLLREIRADLVIGMGGYSIFPGITAAMLGGVPFCLCEQNAVPGRATRLFASWARRTFLNFPVTSDKFQLSARARTVVAGNPLRPKILEFAGRRTGSAGKKKAASKKKATKSSKALTALVLGGSQGAAQINAMVVQAAGVFSGKEIRWIVQCGRAHVEEMQQRLPKGQYPHVELLGYHPGIHEFYKQADVLICRAGAGVLSEGLVFGLPMILVPYPYAADAHQLANARYLEEHGAAVCLDQRDEDPQLLIETLRAWIQKPALRRAAAKASVDLGRPGAAERIRQELEADDFF